MKKPIATYFTSVFLPVLFFIVAGCNDNAKLKAQPKDASGSSDTNAVPQAIKKDSIPLTIIDTARRIDTADYNARIKVLTNNDSSGKWPAKAPYPLRGALLPYNRIVAFYGNLYSKKMGILGEIPKDSMLKKLMGEVAGWRAARFGRAHV